MVGAVFDRQVDDGAGATHLKRRAIILGELLLKIPWRVAFGTAKVNEVLFASQCLGRPGGPLRAIRTVQGWLKEGHGVMFRDARNGFPMIDRHFAGDCIIKDPRLHPLIPMFNLVYGMAGELRLYDRDDGRSCFQLPVSGGLYVGCAAASSLFAICQSKALEAMPGFESNCVAAIVDDLAMRTAKPLESQADVEKFARDVDKVDDALRVAGIFVGGPKDRALLVPGCRLPDNCRTAGAPVLEHTIFGGAVVGLPSAAGPESVNTFSRFNRTLVRMRDLGVRLQDQFILLRHKTSALSYILQATEPRFTKKWQQQALDQIYATVKDILEVPSVPLLPWTQLHIPIYRAGGGLRALDGLDLLFEEGTERTKTLTAAQVLAALHQPRIAKSTRNAIDAFESQLSAGDNRHPLALEGINWSYNVLSLYPSLRCYTITDDAFRRGLRRQLGLQSPHDGLVCRSAVREDASSAQAVLAPDHNLACPTCTAGYRFIRHEEVLAAFCKKCHLFGRPIATNVLGLLGESATIPVNGKPTVFKPDAYCFTSDGDTPKTLFFDVTIAHPSSHPENNASHTKQVQDRYVKKIRDYKPLIEDRRILTAPDRVLQPLVFSTYGAPSYETATFVKEFGKDLRPGFAREVLLSCAAKIWELQHAGLESWYLANRSTLYPCASTATTAATDRQRIGLSARPAIPNTSFAPVATANTGAASAVGASGAAGAASAPSTPQRRGRPSSNANSQSQTPTGMTADAAGSRRRPRTLCECNNPLDKNGACNSPVCSLLSARKTTATDRRRRNAEKPVE